MKTIVIELCPETDGCWTMNYWNKTTPPEKRHLFSLAGIETHEVRVITDALITGAENPKEEKT